MNRGLLRPITDEEVHRYEEDGVVLLKNVFDMDWVERMRDLAAEDMANPGPLHQEMADPEKDGRFFFDTFLWTFHPGFRGYVYNSPAVELAARFMRTSKVNIFFDQLLIKISGTAERTPWHHDMPYWPVVADQICTVWMALDPVTKESGAVEYVKGSHKWGTRYSPPAFAGDDRYKTEYPPVPDIESMRDQFEFLQFDLEPGDCTVHHGLLVHGAPGNSRSDRDRRAVVTRWTGDDAVYTPRPKIQSMMMTPDIPAGGPLDSPLWPVVWRNGQRAPEPDNILVQRSTDTAVAE